MRGARARNRAKHGIDVHCRFGCGHYVRVIEDDETGLQIQLDTEEPSVLVDLTDEDLRHRLWEFRGQYVGWVHLREPQRSFRPLKVEHDCAHTPATHKPRRARPVPVLQEGNSVVHTTSSRRRAG